MERKTVVITGGSRGLGRQIAERFDASGWDLVLIGRSPGARPEWVAPESVVCCDLRRPENIQDAAEKIKQPKIDALINCAGVRNAAPFESKTSTELIDEVTVNMVAPMELTRCLWPKLKASGGMVVNISSIAATTPGHNEVGYSASKAGLNGFSRALQFDATRDGIRVLNLSPGAMKTDMAKDRPEYAMLIDPGELAAKIYRIVSEGDKSFRVPELTVMRAQY